MIRAAMPLAAFRSLLRNHRFGWVLALALWLPVAQWAAATHTLLHLHASVSDAQRDPAPHLPVSCDLCVVAAALGNVAPGPAAMPHAPDLSLGRAPVFLPPAQHFAAPARFYASRAPPLLHA